MSDNRDSENSNSLNNTLEKVFCLVAYLFSLPGIILVRFAGKESRLCLHHARRSFELFLFMAGLFISWCILAYILMFIPYAGFPLGMALFGVIICAGIFCLILSVMGIVKAFKGEAVIFPFISFLAVKIDPFFKKLGFSE
jgi:uncharacterized membrane protein